MEHNFEANFFTLLELLDAAGRLEVEGACKTVNLPDSHLVYKQGDDSSCVYIVVAGTVEAFTSSPDGKKTRSVAFMGKGDFFGDLGVLTGQSRLASVRTCEATKVLQIEKIAFIRLLEKVPKVGAYFSRNLARRLHHTSTEAYVKVYSMDLTGNLQHFDLLTIFQAITGTGRHGELQLSNSANELIGNFFFHKGKVEHARYIHLTGIEAIWQGFVQSVTDGTFTFRIMQEPSSPFGPETKIDLDSTDLLMQGATRRDTYHALPAELRDMKARLSRVGETLTWSGEAEMQPVAEQIWALIAKRPQPLETLWRRLNYSSVTFLEAVQQLLQTGQAQLLADEPAPGEKTA